MPNAGFMPMPVRPRLLLADVGAVLRADLFVRDPLLALGRDVLPLVLADRALGRRRRPLGELRAARLAEERRHHLSTNAPYASRRRRRRPARPAKQPSAQRAASRINSPSTSLRVSGIDSAAPLRSTNATGPGWRQRPHPAVRVVRLRLRCPPRSRGRKRRTDSSSRRASPRNAGRASSLGPVGVLDPKRSPSEEATVVEAPKMRARSGQDGGVSARVGTRSRCWTPRRSGRREQSASARG